MSHHVVYNPTNGRVMQINRGGQWDLESCPAGMSWIETDQEVQGEAWVDLQGVLHNAPPQPSNCHVFDYDSHTWQLSLDLLRAKKLQDVGTERDRVINAVITYLTAQVDADPISQHNIASKILEMQQCQALDAVVDESQLFWLDHNNQLHQFANVADYLQWLGGLAVAISQRGTKAYAWSWQTKAAIAAATTVDALNAITIQCPF